MNRLVRVRRVKERRLPMRMSWVSILVLALLLVGPSIGQASTPDFSIAIDEFVSQLLPRGTHYYWVINDAKAETQRELIVDINTTVRSHKGVKLTERRYLLLLIDGKLLAAQNIPLGAEVDCGNEEEV